MDANQLAEGIARAVEAAKPAQEYCLFGCNHWSMCMTKAEWSGWMQAIFSVVAIFSAALLTWWQLRAPRVAAAANKKRHDLELSAAALLTCERASRLARSTSRDFLKASTNDPWLKRLESRWANLLACIDVLLSKDLDGDALKLLLDTRGFASVALAACQTRELGMHTEARFAASFDVISVKSSTAEARWRLRKLVRARRAELDSRK
jgi:hypothetical protein